MILWLPFQKKAAFCSPSGSKKGGMVMASKTTMLLWCFVVVLLGISAPLWADDVSLKPFVLAYSGEGTIDAKLGEVKAAVEREGFQVVGEYAPYKGTHIVVVTSEELKNNAAKSKFGAYGAIQRISLTEKGKGLQVAYSNPLYLAQAYRMKDSLSDTAAKLDKALGKKETFGSKNGLKADKLRNYHYMMLMPYFTDQVELAKHKSYEEAIQAVESNLTAGKGGTLRVYRVDLPGKKETVFGVGIKDGEGADAAVMKTVDIGELRQTAHLPYELIVSDGTVYMLHGKFRIAVDFPDLTMGTFMKISGAPSAIENALKQVAGGK
jgi:hypothetical protein